jgi:hypothetical protein
MTSVEVSKETALAELQISEFKEEIDELLTRFYFAYSAAPEMQWSLRTSLAETSLQNCRQIASYVRRTSPGAANELEMRIRSAAARFRTVKKSRDPDLLHSWFKEELAPLLNKSEQAAYLVASNARMSSLGSSEPFTWALGGLPGGEEHIRRFGKPAQEFGYLEQTCPICGGRVDEMGWCGCGNIGGG